MYQWFQRYLQSPTGPKTLHFWAPAANGFFSVQGLYDWNRDPVNISKEMQFILVCYSSLFLRFSWMIKPRSYILFTVHSSNLFLQGRLLLKRLEWERQNPEKALQQKQIKEHAQQLAKEKQQLLETKSE